MSDREPLWVADMLEARGVVVELRELVASLAAIVKDAEARRDELDDVILRARREARHLSALTDTGAGIAATLRR